MTWPHEVKLHQINNYLQPIVNELLELWDGVDLPETEINPAGKRIRLAVICCSNDIPAAKKLCGHISALAGCHRCYKRAGFEDMPNWFKMRDPEEHRHNAILWKYKLTKKDRKQHVRATHVSGKLTKSHLEIMESRAKQIKIPADLERIPSKISTGEGFSGFIADQWRSFILIYATPLMWDLLNDPDQKILANFVRAYYLLDYNPLYSFWCYSFERMNGLLVEGLKLVKSWLTTGSLLAYDNFEWDELYRFRLIYSLEVEDTITGSEQFPREIMTPRKQDVILPNNIYKLLVDYYNNVYNLEFVTIADSIESRLQSRHPIVVRPIINQYGCI
uniref:Transposase domain-containing protein n=1 Tax=Rhizophagus irregularis (strain DAOM 181602 / DAOM 197198 / MUCL 43194) TaxID=747089 RepID=U9UPJ4_RHIID